MPEDRPPPLAGVVVLDFGQVYQGPYAGLLLAKAGADVIKIEPPRGEPLRAREAVGGGASLPLAMLNSNKRTITLNLKSPKGVALLTAHGAQGRRAAGELRARRHGPAGGRARRR